MATMGKPKKKPAHNKSKYSDWWLTRTPEQQADYIYEKMLEKGKHPNWQEIYNNVIKSGNYQK